MDAEFPGPSLPADSRVDVLIRYLDYFRDRVIAKTEGLDEDERRRSRLSSGWTPIELVKHLTFVELRWLEWSFEGREVDAPWGDRLHHERDQPWHVAPDEATEDVIAALATQGARSRAVIAAHDLADVGRPGPHWRGEPATLERVLLHLIQEYARHLGHLDIVAELAGEPVGE
ncbi:MULTISPECIES: DinB family protein [Aeromicrobium]|uniref:DinB family protein n=1 Tax=Aeromicrobium TaxID=2040 RepID=UPI00257F4114|nr:MULTISPECIES: DinB family protein [Aeromicrobium]